MPKMMPKPIPAAAARKVNSTTDSSRGDVGAIIGPSSKRSSCQPLVELHVLPPLHVPGEIPRHAVDHHPLPEDGLVEGVEGAVERPDQTFGGEMIEDETGALARGGIEGLDGVGEAAGLV